MRMLICLLIPGSLLLPLLATAEGPASGPTVSIALGARHAHVTPCRKGCTHTGGGNIDVAQPAPDTVVVTMTGVAVATPSPCGASAASLEFCLEQCFDLSFDDPKLKQAKLQLSGRVMGLLRSERSCGKNGSASHSPGNATVCCGDASLVTLTVAPHSVAGGENLSVNCAEGTFTLPVVAGRYTLRQQFSVSACAPRSFLPLKSVSAEFAPDPALDPLWISYWEPFHGATKKDFGFQITLKVVPDTAAGK